MNIRHLGLLAIIFLHACSTTPALDENAVITVEDTAETSSRSHIQPPDSDDCRFYVRSTPQKVYRWVDKDGAVYYGDSIPAEYAKKPNQAADDQEISRDELPGRKSAEQLEAEIIARYLEVPEELQRRSDQGAFKLCSLDGVSHMPCDRCAELSTAQQRVAELYIHNLQQRLAVLEEKAKFCMPYNSDPNAPMIAESLLRDIQVIRESIKRHQANLEKFQSICPELRTPDHLAKADFSHSLGSKLTGW